ncbi:MAG: hypothetical protein ACRDKL_02330, partial [Solirubrobacteraceae bacterium]
RKQRRAPDATRASRSDGHYRNAHMRRRILTGGLLILAGAVSWAAPVASAAPLNPAVAISAMSCPQAGHCAAAGSYNDGLGNGQGLLLDERHGVWHTAVEAPLPAGAAPNPLNPANNTGVEGIACIGAGDCTAVGVYTDRKAQDRGLLLSEHHGRWMHGIPARLPANAQRPPKGHSVAADNLALLAVGCVSPGDCYAVGNYVTEANTLQGLIIAERGGRWRRGTVAPLPPGASVRGQQAALYTVSCLPSGGCVATGSYKDANGAQQGVLLSENGGTWRAATEARLPSGAGSDPQVTPIAVTCVTRGNCAAAGDYKDSRDNSLGLLLAETNGNWTDGAGALLPANSAPPFSYNAQATVIAALACIDAGDCAAVGSYTDGYGNTEALLLDQDAGSWQRGEEVKLPSNAIGGATRQTAGLDAVSCPALGDCVAGGLYTDTAENDDSLLVAQSGGVWSAGVEVRLPRDAGSSQDSAVDGVSCARIGECVAIGTFADNHGDTVGYTVAEHGGVWTRAVQLPSPAPNAAEVRLSVQELLKPGGKLATIAAIGKTGKFEQPYVLLRPGRLSLAWYQRQRGRSVLVAAGKAKGVSAGSGQMTLRLTRAGRMLFSHGRRLTLGAVAALRPRSGRALSASGTFSLR